MKRKKTTTPELTVKWTTLQLRTRRKTDSRKNPIDTVSLKKSEKGEIECKLFATSDPATIREVLESTPPPDIRMTLFDLPQELKRADQWRILGHHGDVLEQIVRESRWATDSPQIEVLLDEWWEVCFSLITSKLDIVDFWLAMRYPDEVFPAEWDRKYVRLERKEWRERGKSLAQDYAREVSICTKKICDLLLKGGLTYARAFQLTAELFNAAFGFELTLKAVEARYFKNS